MILKMYCVYDSKISAYMHPMFFRSNGEALRAFAAAVNDPSHGFNKHPEDYTLFELGSFNDDKATVTMLSSPASLGVAIEFKQFNPLPSREVLNS